MISPPTPSRQLRRKQLGTDVVVVVVPASGGSAAGLADNAPLPPSDPPDDATLPGLKTPPKSGRSDEDQVSKRSGILSQGERGRSGDDGADNGDGGRRKEDGEGV